ncbi:MAG TPA: glycoside hydrolase family 30 beta sandwich domain-containing protein [Ferruginibacter sp.]|jgi:glucosylceramidase|nr:glycoside hydrolase family 30 beta sandwich domain-containing protein [Ferruginibacter sp.]HPH89731.1 glycoside hydrolase family 30 beta sandwich domain-containing protein [Ferruginibacter sp.]
MKTFFSSRQLALLLCTLFLFADCTKKADPVQPPVPTPGTPTGKADHWLTTGSRSVLLGKQTALSFYSTSARTNIISVDSAIKYQTVDGFGYTLTGGSASLINNLPPATKSDLLQELFSNAENAIAINYLRVSIGASDLSASVFSYDDLQPGNTDINLDSFNLSKDTVDVIPLLKQILAINPNIKILGSPWSPPVWMKNNNSSVGGSLLPQYYAVYANYFVKYIQAMKANGITIDAVTIQNEPQHGGNNPSLVMSSTEQADFIKNHLGPAFQSAAINTKIIIWDHNCDNPQYPLNILNDAAARAFVDGSAFHLYAGDISALSAVHNAYPDKNVYFTEQWTSATGGFDGDLKWHLKNVIIGSMRNWSKVALEWNLANDPTFGPHTVGGCTECKGALTVSAFSYTKNVSYYIIAHASKFVPAGSVRVSSSTVNNLSNVAFVTPSGKKVLIVLNEGSTDAIFTISYKGNFADATLAAGAVATYVWN